MKYTCEECGIEFIRNDFKRPNKYCSQKCYGKARTRLHMVSCHKTTHGHTTKDKASSTYSKWQGMKTRCYNPNSNRFKYYGGKGIIVCDRWLNSFENFLEDMGECPEGLTLDMIDSNKNYEPDNCKWSTLEEQSRNRSGVKHFTINGRTQCLNQWVKEFGLRFNNVKRKLMQGISIEQALGITNPV